MKTNTAVRTLLGGALCWLFVSAGCGVTQGVNNNVAAVRRVDWGMSLNTNGTNGVGQFPAKFTFDVNAPITVANCTTDFIVYNTAQSINGPAPDNASIIAFNNLYSTQGSAGGLCNQNGPSVYWSYFTGRGNTPTSPVLSEDGSKVAFVETESAGTLVILQWKAGEGTNNVALAPAPDQDISGSNWSTCTPGNSCVALLPFVNSIQDHTSPPFYNYNTDVLYVGDDLGVLHKFTGVFKGTPAEVNDSFWPVHVNGTNQSLTGPIYDGVSGNIYVGDSSGLLKYVRETGSTVGTCGSGSPPCLGSTAIQVGTGGAIVDAPIVDGTTGMVFAVNGAETSNNGVILQAPTDFSSSVTLNIGGTTAAGSAIYGGDFDNTYFSSSPGSISGHMYVCGKDHSLGDRPAVYQLSFNSAGVLTGASSPLTALASADGEACSPVTEFYNSTTATDRIFFSIGNNANNGGTNANNPLFGSNCQTSNIGCVLSIDVTSGATWPPTLPSVLITAQTVPPSNTGSTSGMVVDNVSASSQASNIYFSLGANSIGSGPGLPSCNTTAGVGCAIKLQQSNLQ